MTTTQAAYMTATVENENEQDSPYVVTAKIGDIVYIADIDRQGQGTLDITLASPEPIPDTSWTQIQNNVSVHQLGQARITRVFTHHELELDWRSSGTYLLIHVKPLTGEEVFA